MTLSSSMLLSLVMITSLSSLSLAEDSAIAVEPPNLEGIWTMNLGCEQVTMMIRRHESRLIGACTGGESSPWNAVVAGLLAENEIELRAESLQHVVIVVTELYGSTDGDTINGSFLEADSLGNVTGGKATAIQDISEYISFIHVAVDEMAGTMSGCSLQPK